jgi:hypothetical protein
MEKSSTKMQLRVSSPLETLRRDQHGIQLMPPPNYPFHAKLLQHAKTAHT